MEDNLVLPDSFLLRLSDPGLELVDTPPLEIGSEVEVAARRRRRARAGQRLQGPDHDARAGVQRRGRGLAARGYDESHLLHRTQRTTTYQNMTASRHREEGRAEGRVCRRGRVEAPARPTPSSSRTTRPTGSSSGGSPACTTSRCSSATSSCTSALRGAGGCIRDTLRWGEELRSFRPRVTGDPAGRRGRRPRMGSAAQGEIEATARIGRPAPRSASSATPWPAPSAGTRSRSPTARSRSPARPTSARGEHRRPPRERLPRGGGRRAAGTPVWCGLEASRSRVSATRFSGTYTLSSTTSRLPRREGLQDPLRRLRPRLRGASST